jgi:hypothetical protein
MTLVVHSSSSSTHDHQPDTVEHLEATRTRGIEHIRRHRLRCTIVAGCRAVFCVRRTDSRQELIPDPRHLPLRVLARRELCAFNTLSGQRGGLGACAICAAQVGFELPETCGSIKGWSDLG